MPVASLQHQADPQDAFWYKNHLTIDEIYCLYEKNYEEGDPTAGPFCGNCWRSVGTSRMCLAFFIILSTCFVILCSLMVLYLRYRRLTSTSESYWSYYKVFVFILGMLAAQIISLTDAFINYSFKVQAWLLALPNTCTFIFIAYAVSNLIQLDYLLREQEPMGSKNRRLRTFNILAFLCILTQIASPILLQFESGTSWYKGIPWYKQEADPYFYARNSLTTVADLILLSYCLVFMARLQRRLNLMGEAVLGRIKTRITFLCVIIEIFLIVYLLLVWL